MPTYALPDPSGSGTIYASGNSLQEAEQTAASARGMASWTGGSFGADSGSGASTSPNPGPATINPQGLVNPNLGGLNALGAQVSGVTQQQLAQQKQEFDAQLQFAQQQMQQLGIPQLQINQQLAQMQQQQFQSQLALAQQAQQYSQAATTAQLTGQFTPPPGVPGVSQWTGQASGGAPGAVAPAGLAPGTMVKGDQTAGVGQVQADGTIRNFANPAEFQAAGGTINPDGSFAGLSIIPQALYATGKVALTSGGVGGAGGTQQTLAGALQQAQLSGQYQGAPTEAASEFARQLQQAQEQFAAQQAQQQGQFEQSFGLQQGQLGQQYLATAAQLQGPQNTFQLSNYLRGAQGNQNVPTYLQSLANNVGMPAFQGTGSTPPNTQTAAGLAGQLGGTTSATPGWDYNQTLGAIQGIMGQGAQSLGPGALERLTPDELSALGSGIGAAGGSLPSFLQQYQQSRIGQQAPTQTALA